MRKEKGRAADAGEDEGGYLVWFVQVARRLFARLKPEFRISDRVSTWLRSAPPRMVALTHAKKRWTKNAVSRPYRLYTYGLRLSIFSRPHFLTAP